MRVWKVRPRPDWMDVGDCPDSAAFMCDSQEMAQRLGRFLWGRHYEVQEHDTEKDVFAMNSD